MDMVAAADGKDAGDLVLHPSTGSDNDRDRSEAGGNGWAGPPSGLLRIAKAGTDAAVQAKRDGLAVDGGTQAQLQIG